MNYCDAKKFIDSKLKFGSKLGLERIKKLMDLLGNPQEKIRFVHVAGTNGKGSVCYMLSSIFKTAGLKAGLFISPSISDFRERIQINGQKISKKKLCNLIDVIRPYTEDKFFDDNPITEFELVTAIGFKYFSDCKCDIVVLETGMGGRFDATNVIKSPMCSVITSISFDHTNVLGNTLSEISFEKAGIIKQGCPVVLGENQEKIVSDVICDISNKLKSNVKIADSKTLKNFSENIDSGISFEYRGKKVVVPIHGLYQKSNIATALATLEILNSSLKISMDNVVSGFKNLKIPCRMECFGKKPMWIFDACHNPSGVSYLLKYLKYKFNKRNFFAVISVFKDKDVEKMMSLITPIFERVYVISANCERSLSSEELKSIIAKYNKNVFSCKSALEAFKKAQVECNCADIGVVFGTFSIMSEFKKIVKFYTKQNDKTQL